MWILKVKFVWYDLWVGFYWDRNSNTLYFCPFPTLVFVFQRIPLFTEKSGLFNLIRKTIVIAGNQRQYISYLRENNLNQKDFSFVNSIDQIRGLRNVTIVKYGEWWKNPIWDEPGIEEYLKIITEEKI